MSYEDLNPLLRVLDGLRVGLHIMFAFLLGFGVLRSLVDDTLNAAVPFFSVALAALYMAGTVYERHQAKQGSEVASASRYAWLTGIIVLWLLLLTHSQDFLWLEFPLVLLTLHIVALIPALLTSLGLWLVAAFVPLWLHPETWAVAAAVGPLIGTVFAIAIYFAYRALHAEVQHHRQVAQQLRATQEELAASEHQSGRLEERERLSREIHDTVAQGLSSIVLLARAAKSSDEVGSQLAQQLGTIESVAVENLAEARRFVRDLASPDVEQSLPDALRATVNRMRSRGTALGEDTEFRVEFVGTGGAAQVPQPIAACVIRCAQEGLSNVVKHAQAQTAVVTLGIFDDSVTIDVVDDGIGIDTPGLSLDSDTFGLAGLKRRVEAQGGEMTIESHTGSGTALAARLPLTSGTLSSSDPSGSSSSSVSMKEK